MTVRKLSISVPPEVEETIKAAAADEGKPVSAWLAEAATEKARAAALHAAARAAARELVAEYESERGPLPAASRQRARQFLIEAGLIDDGASAGRWVMPAIVYDTGALLAAERRNPDFLAAHDELTSAHIRPLVPVVVLAQAWRGGLQHQISRVLKACDILPDDQRTGRAAGIACTASGTANVVDAIVIVTAVRHQAPVVTSDPGDLTRIADSITWRSGSSQPDDHQGRAP